MLVAESGDCQQKGTSAAGHTYPEACPAAEGWAQLAVPGRPVHPQQSPWSDRTVRFCNHKYTNSKTQDQQEGTQGEPGSKIITIFIQNNTQKITLCRGEKPEAD